MSKFNEYLRNAFGMNAGPHNISEVRPRANTIPSINHRNDYQGAVMISYTGEKTPGEMGIAREYYPQYSILRTRSWQLFLESDIAQMVTNKYLKWVIGDGLQLSAEPIEDQVSNVPEGLTKEIEQRWKMWAGSKMADRSGMMNLHQIAKEAKKTAMVGGDCLVLLGADEDTALPTVRILDGELVMSPVYGAQQYQEAKKRGNYISYGVEVDRKGKHVAYYVRKRNQKKWGEVERVPVINEVTGMKQAFLVYGFRYRLRNLRGIPYTSAVMESLKKIDRYKEATVAGAEERAKIPYTINHDIESTGENPLTENIKAGLGLNRMEGYVASEDRTGNKIRDEIAVTAQKQVYNMPQGSKLEAMESKQEVNFEAFYFSNIRVITATLGMPVEVALSKYDNNFSSSRAALKDWENTIDVDRSDFATQFYKPIYELFLSLQVASNAVLAPGLFPAMIAGDVMTVMAWYNCRFRGRGVPHIDPVKEVEAERRKLGPKGANIPLTTAQQATEALGTGDFEQNVSTFDKELEMAGGAPEPPAPPQVVPPQEEDQENDDDDDQGND
jgi:lambda family phage portal protein